MIIAPYTPDTIAKLRRMASHYELPEIAKRLGWDKALVLSVARKHQIELKGSSLGNDGLNQGGEIASVSYLRSPELAPAQTTATYPDGVEWYPRAREVCRHGIVASLASAQAHVFEVLYQRLRSFEPDCFVPASGLAKGNNVAQIARGLCRKLAPMRIKIEGNKGRGGGYRLVVEVE